MFKNTQRPEQNMRGVRAMVRGSSGPSPHILCVSMLVFAKVTGNVGQTKCPNTLPLSPLCL